jgi:penicillin-binding protein 2
MPDRPAADTGHRLRFLGVAVLSLFVALFARLWYLQVLTAEEADAIATANATRVIPIPAGRGRIFDAQGRVLVDNRVSTVVAVNPQQLERAMPDEVDRREMFTRLAVEINRAGALVKTADLESAYRNPSYSPYADVPIAYDVSEDLLVFVAERADQFPGVTVREATIRSYPFGELAAHVLGWIGSINREEWEARRDHPKSYQLNDEIGKGGVEQMFEDELRGVPGRRIVEVDARGRLVRERPDLYVAPQPGNDVHLAIDVDVQAVAEAELAQAVRIARRQKPKPGDPPFLAPGGSVVVLDPSDGKVVAMASYPTYNPNDAIGGFPRALYDQLTDPQNGTPLLNRAVQGAYPPGSTFKPVTAVAALREGVFGSWVPFLPDQPQYDPGTYTLRSCFYTGDDREQIQKAGCVFNNAGKTPHAGVDLPRSLTVSSDWYYYQLGEAFWVGDGFNRNAIQDTAREFGLGERSGIQLPFGGEVAGRVPTPEDRREQHEANPDAFPNGEWFSGDNVNLSIGQGDLLVTPLQLANLYAILANGGTRYAPQLVREVHRRTPDGGVEIAEFGARVLGDVDLPEEQLQPIIEGLLGVTTVGGVDGGTAYGAFHGQGPGAVAFPVGSFPVVGKTGTAEKKTATSAKADYSLFAGFGPWPEPRYVAVAVLEEAGFGSRVAAPLVARVLEPIARGTIRGTAVPQEIRYARFVSRGACTAWDEANQEGEGAEGGTAVEPAASTLPLDPLLPVPPTVRPDGTVAVGRVQVSCVDVLADIAAEQADEAEAERAAAASASAVD